METLTPPSREVAARIVREVGFEDRLIGSSLHLRAGIRVLSLYSLEEVFLLLKEPHPHIDLDQLESWIRTVIQDGELADRMKTVIGQKTADQDVVPLIRDLMGWRLIQCKQLT